MKELDLEQMEKVEGGSCMAGLGIGLSTGLFHYAALFGPVVLGVAIAGACAAGAVASR